MFTREGFIVDDIRLFGITSLVVIAFMEMAVSIVCKRIGGFFRVKGIFEGRFGIEMTVRVWGSVIFVFSFRE